MLGFFDRGAAFRVILVEINFEFLDFCTDFCQILKNFVETNFDFSGLCKVFLIEELHLSNFS